MTRLIWGLQISTLTLILLFSVNSTAQTGDPYFNVMTYGAKCDGSTHDTNAFQQALNAANNAHGGMVYVPLSPTGRPCVIDQQLIMDNFSGVSFAGPNAGNGGFGSMSNPTVLFTAATGTPNYPALISIRSAQGVFIKNLTLQYNSSDFAANFIDLSPAPGCSPNLCTSSKMVYIADSTIEGTNTPLSATSATLIYLDDATDITIERNIFEWATNAIVGQAETPGHFSNGVRIRDNRFGGYNTNSISGNMILDLGMAWVIEGNVFEMAVTGGTSSNHPIPINGNSKGCAGCQITGNWIGDVNPQFAGALITGVFQGTSITGNLISGAASTQATGVLLTGCGSGTSITGNTFSSLAFAIGFPNNCPTNIFVAGNQYDSVAAPFSGAPANGMISNNGVTHVYGTLMKTAGSFVIDDPVDPANKYLSHSFVESPDMMNIYNGVVTLDAHGRATVALPSYFEALNRDFRYQLTPLGGFAPLYIAKKIRGDSFGIAGGKSGMEVSWQVTGIRHDAYADANRIAVEKEKPSQEKGHFSNSSPKNENIHEK